LLSVIKLNVILLNAVTLSVIKQNVILLSVIMLTVVKLNVVLLNVVAATFASGAFKLKGASLVKQKKILF
jgi:hypothetical protein